MLSPRENYLITSRGGKGEYVPDFFMDANSFWPPFARANPGDTDMFGVRWVGNDAGHIPDERYHVMTDIAQWRDIVHLPKPSELDWAGMAEEFNARRDPNKVTSTTVPVQLFLTTMNMMGFVDGLCAIYENPDELEAFVSELCDFGVECIKYESKYFKPDIMGTGDDIANATGPFVSRETWTELYRPYFKKIVDAIHEVGALAEFHNCGRCAWLIDECLDIGCDILQLPEPDDDLRRAKKQYGNRLVITGGWDRHGEGSMPNATEEEVRRSVHTALDEWGKDGGLIFWDGGIVGTSEDSRNKMKWVTDEFRKYRFEIYK